MPVALNIEPWLQTQHSAVPECTVHEGKYKNITRSKLDRSSIQLGQIKTDKWKRS